MNAKLTLFAGVLMPLLAAAQINIDATLTPAQIVQQELIGIGITAFNVSYNGAPDPSTPQIGSGTFTVINSNLGLAEGAVLSNGNVNGINQPASNFISGINGTGSDPDLVLLSGGVINDRAVLEFDFIPIGDTLMVGYVFGSEEYPEFVCAFNDVFGFFLSGPGISGPYTNNAANIALVPNTTTIVGINEINDGINNNPNDPNCPAMNAQYYVDNSLGTSVAFDGMTTGLEAHAPVQPGQVYHIKLAVGDALDQVYDSGVFLEGGSFRSSIPLGINTLAGTSALALFPNPATSSLTLPYSANGRNVEVLDVLGRPVMQSTYTRGLPLDVSALPHGTYTLRLYDAQGVGTAAGRFVRE